MELAQFDKVASVILRAFEDSGKAQDAVFSANPVFALLNKKGKKQVEGGRDIQINVNYKKNDTVGSYSGWDVADTTPQDTIGRAFLPWAQYRGAVSVDGRTIAMNDSANSVVQIVSHETELAVDSLRDLMAAHSYGDGTGNDGKDIVGMAAITGQTNTYAGVNRAATDRDYTFWRAKSHTAAKAVSLDRLMNLINSVKGSSSGEPSKVGVVDLISMPQNLYESCHDLILPHARVKGTGVGDLGFSSLAYAGTELVWEQYVPAGTIYFLSTKYMGLRVMPGRDFKMSEWMTPVNQDGRIAYVYWMGQLVCRNPRFIGVATNKTA